MTDGMNSPDQQRLIASLLSRRAFDNERRSIIESLPFELGKTRISIRTPRPNDPAWECFPMSVEVERMPDSLVCCLQSEHGGWWERWNLEHTLEGIRQGFYRVEAIEKAP